MRTGGKALPGIARLIDGAGGKDRNVKVHVVPRRPGRGIPNTRRAKHRIDCHGHEWQFGLARAVLGSVTERVVRQSPTPVLTIPPSAELRDDLMPFDPILCASDFSPACRKALDMAILMGQEADARLILLHALQLPDFDPGIVPVRLPVSTRTEYSGISQGCSRRLKCGLPADAVFRCRPEPVVTEGRPTDVILQTASKRGRQANRDGSPDSRCIGSTDLRLNDP